MTKKEILKQMKKLSKEYPLKISQRDYVLKIHTLDGYILNLIVNDIVFNSSMNLNALKRLRGKIVKMMEQI